MRKSLQVTSSLMYLVLGTAGLIPRLEVPCRADARLPPVRRTPSSPSGLSETGRLREVIGERRRWHAVRGHLHELNGDLPATATAYADAARRATNIAERDRLIRQAAPTHRRVMPEHDREAKTTGFASRS